MKARFLVAAGVAMFCTLAQAQQTQMKTITPTGAELAAGKTASRSTLHPIPALTPAGAKLGKEGLPDRPAIVANTPLPPGGNRYPGDLTYLGGPVVGDAQFHAIYLLNSASSNTLCTVAACWGDPEGFLTSLGKSDFIHLVDQYIGRYDSRRYRNGPDAGVIMTPALPKLTDADVLGMIYAVLTQANYPTGEDQIYHVFLPPGTDECFDSTYSQCYSPDNPKTFAFCGYHSSADFPGVGHVLYSVEPYQNVPGCNVLPGTPNGPLVDATNNVLSHETFETITDPEGNAWINIDSNAMYGEEIGDECEFIYFTQTEGGFNPSVFRMAGKKYAVQPEYNNSGHACSTSLDD
jgi:hypothetical protein